MAVRIARSGFLTVLKRRDFLIFVVGQTVSQFGEKFHHIVLIALVGVYADGAPSALAALGVTFTLPSILLAPVVGTLIDRWNRRSLLVASDAIRFAGVASIPFILSLSGWFHLIYPLVFFVFLMGLFLNTSKLAVIPDLVKRNQLLAANSVSLFVIRLATISGMVIGGYLVALSVWQRMGVEGWKAGFLINALFFLVSAILFSRLSSLSRPRLTLDQPFLSDLKAASSMVFAGRVIPFVMISAFLLCLVGAAVYVLVVSRVQQELGAGTKGVSLMAGCVASGTIVGAVLYSWLGQRMAKTNVICGCFSIVGVLLIFFSMTSTTSRLLILSITGGLFLAPIPIAQDTLLHEHLSERERGRVFGIRDWVVNLFFAVGSLILGGLATLTSTRTSLMGAGIFVLAGGFVLWLIWTRWEGERLSSP